MSDSINDAVIGIVGTVVGTVLGFMLQTVSNNFGKNSLNISDIEVSFGTGKSDGEGGYFGSWVEFLLNIINRKNKTMFLEKFACEFYNNGKRMHRTMCYDKSSHIKAASRTIHNEITYIEMPPISCKDINVCVRPSGDMTECDKVIITYSWGFKQRKKVIWTKESTHANT